MLSLSATCHRRHYCSSCYQMKHGSTSAGGHRTITIHTNITGHHEVCSPQIRITHENFCVADYHPIILQLIGRILQPTASITRQVDVATQVEAIPESLVYYKYLILKFLLDNYQSNWESSQILCTHSNVVLVQLYRRRRPSARGSS